MQAYLKESLNSFRFNEKLIKVLKSTGEVGNIIYKGSIKPEYALGYAFSKDTETLRLAAYATHEEKTSPVYYYDVQLKTLEDKSYDDLDKLIDIVMENKTTNNNKCMHELNSVYNYLTGVTDLLLVESINTFSNRPYLDCHTAKLRLTPSYDLQELAHKTVVVVEDDNNNIKNVVCNNQEITDILKLKTVEQRLEYINPIRKQLLERKA